MIVLANLINSDAVVTERSTVAEDPVPLIDSGAPKHPYADSLSEPPSKRLRGSSSRRIQCKARGLSNNHNSDNAYFEIPADAPHGLLVSCSHPECTGSGRRGFRYCQVCDVPVAKRNFLKRHGHGIVKSAKHLQEEVDDVCGVAIDTPQCKVRGLSNTGAPKHPFVDSPLEPPSKRLRGSSPRRIQCKARGLSNNHNSDNAYFEIPADAPHGLLVSCSHPECTGSGRRGFRYCQVCDVPVAKRNFLKRHGHGIVKSAKQLQEEVDGVCGVAIDTPQFELSCQPCEGFATEIPPWTTGVATEQLSFDRSEYCRLDANELDWFGVLHRLSEASTSSCS